MADRSVRYTKCANFDMSRILGGFFLPCCFQSYYFAPRFGSSNIVIVLKAIDYAKNTFTHRFFR